MLRRVVLLIMVLLLVEEELDDCDEVLGETQLETTGSQFLVIRLGLVTSFCLACQTEKDLCCRFSSWPSQNSLIAFWVGARVGVWGCLGLWDSEVSVQLVLYESQEFFEHGAMV